MAGLYSMDIELAKYFTKVINIWGDPFSSKCLDLISGSTVKVIDVEHPVTYPRPNFGNPGKDVVIDAWGKVVAGNNEIHLVFEFKKADADFKTWLFYKNLLSLPQQPSSHISHIAISKNTEKDIWEMQTQVVTLSVDQDKTPVCIFGREIRLDFDKKDTKNNTKSTNARIYQASEQSVTGSYGLNHDHIEFFRHLIDKKTINADKKIWFIPVIVTTAELFTVTLDQNNIDLATGEIDESKVKPDMYKNEEAILYSFPVPGQLRHRIPDENIHLHPVDERDSFNKAAIMIVNIRYLESFLKYIQKAFPG